MPSEGDVRRRYSTAPCGALVVHEFDAVLRRAVRSERKEAAVHDAQHATHVVEVVVRSAIRHDHAAYMHNMRHEARGVSALAPERGPCSADTAFRLAAAHASALTGAIRKDWQQDDRKSPLKQVLGGGDSVTGVGENRPELHIAATWPYFRPRLSESATFAGRPGPARAMRALVVSRLMYLSGNRRQGCTGAPAGLCIMGRAMHRARSQVSQRAHFVNVNEGPIEGRPHEHAQVEHMQHVLLVQYEGMRG